jgi:hypothetical protein
MAYRSRYATPPPRPPRPSRLRVILPTLIMLGLSLVVAGAWAFASWRTGREIDGWIAREASLGRIWTCPDRRIGGFPFRIEVSCNDPAFEGRADGREVSGGLTRILAVAQIYSPNHVIVEVDGPLSVRETSTGSAWTVAWDTLRASVVGQPGSALERISVQAVSPSLVATGPAGTFSATARAFETHLRRTPGRPEADGAYDIAATLAKATIPPLDAWLRGGDPTDVSVVMTVTKAEPLVGHGLTGELDRWRDAGGRLQLTNATLAKGAKRVEATGSLALDAFRRPEGRVELSLTGLDELLQSLGLGGRSATIGGLIAGVLSGRPTEAAPPAPGAAGAAGATRGVVLPLRFEGGRAYLGPIPVASLPPLY